MKIKLVHKFEDIVNVNNLLEAWLEFLDEKKNKKDVQEFQFSLMDNILSLHYDLINRDYKHGGYQCFKINDPKPRIIHKATVRDRLLHRAVYRMICPFFARTFISDSFSCQINKGTHKAIKKFREYASIVSENNTKTCWVLKCDIKKFFASIDQNVLIGILHEYISDADILNLLSEIIGSFYSTEVGKGLPLGNLTSQLLANIYMNKFDQYVKHKLKAEYYVRYADDFVISSQDKKWLEDVVPAISNFLSDNLKLQLHPDKVFIKTIASGVDFLGWVNFPNHKVLRDKTQKRMFRRLEETQKLETINSYLGLLKHGNTNRIRDRIFMLCDRPNNTPE